MAKNYRGVRHCYRRECKEYCMILNPSGKPKNLTSICVFEGRHYDKQLGADELKIEGEACKYGFPVHVQSTREFLARYKAYLSRRKAYPAALKSKQNLRSQGHVKPEGRIAQLRAIIQKEREEGGVEISAQLDTFLETTGLTKKFEDTELGRVPGEDFTIPQG